MKQINGNAEFQLHHGKSFSLSSPTDISICYAPLGMKKSHKNIFRLIKSSRQTNKCIFVEQTLFTRSHRQANRDGKKSSPRTNSIKLRKAKNMNEKIMQLKMLFLSSKAFLHSINC